MEFLAQWWGGLEPLTRWFFGIAFFFSAFFLWQLFGAFMGLHGGDGGMDSTADSPTIHHSPEDASASVEVFRLISLRSVLAFLTIFCWAGALELQARRTVGVALGLSFVWGIVAMVLVAWLLYGMRRMAETGNLRYNSCVGCEASVYLDIPAGGVGEVRTLVNGTVTHLKARHAAAAGLKAGTAVRVVRLVGPGTVEVTPVTKSA
jgi:membrane protein implicated in regulation of membrane protease activity